MQVDSVQAEALGSRPASEAPAAQDLDFDKIYGEVSASFATSALPPALRPNWDMPMAESGEAEAKVRGT